MPPWVRPRSTHRHYSRRQFGCRFTEIVRERAHLGRAELTHQTDGGKTEHHPSPQVQDRRTDDGYSGDVVSPINAIATFSCDFDFPHPKFESRWVLPPQRLETAFQFGRRVAAESRNAASCRVD